MGGSNGIQRTTTKSISWIKKRKGKEVWPDSRFNYKFAKDFAYIYYLKNRCHNLIDINTCMHNLEEHTKEWFIWKLKI